MGQFALGIRSLVIKATVFVIMAALLAWALGGTLWPRPHVIELRDQGARVGDAQVFWRLTLEQRSQESPQWKLMMFSGKDAPSDLDSRTWADIAQPMSDGSVVHFGGRTHGGQWFISRIQLPSRAVEDRLMPDRLAVEQQLARIAAGLPIQDAKTIAQQRAAVLDPGSVNPQGLEPESEMVEEEGKTSSAAQAVPDD
jgi:hypothetical protein